MTVSAKSHQGNRKKGEVERMEEKENGSYLRLIPGMCLEDKMN